MCEAALVIDEAAAVPVVTVFSDGPGGGNPAPVVLDARGWNDAQMQQVARVSGHESAFVVDAAGTDCDLALRFWVPNHEMSMCGHATVGAVWLMRQRGMLPEVGEIRVHTASGVVRARIDAHGSVSVSQPLGTATPVRDDRAVLQALGLARSQLDGRVRNAVTSRTKTLVPVRNEAVLDALLPEHSRVESACAGIDSTGLYPYTRTGEQQFDARQFPRSSGYPEDPATGIAAAALASALLEDGTVTMAGGPVTIRQGRAMGRPSRITITFDETADASAVCWLGGPVETT